MLVQVFSFCENDLVLNQFYVRDPRTRQKKVRVKPDEIRSAIRPLIPVLVLIFVSDISLLLLQSAVNSATGTVPEY